MPIGIILFFILIIVVGIFSFSRSTSKEPLINGVVKVPIEDDKKLNIETSNKSKDIHMFERYGREFDDVQVENKYPSKSSGFSDFNM